MTKPTIETNAEDHLVVESTQGRTTKTTACVQGSRRPPSALPSDARMDPRTTSLGTASQVGEYLICSELVHENRWNEAVAKVGKGNLHLILSELAAPADAEDDFSTTNLLRERKLTRYQIDQILAGNLMNLVLGPFIIRKRIGRGGMAEVLQAYNRELDRIEAVKVLRADRQRTSIDLAALARREARVLASLVHPNITTVFRADTIGNTTYLSMEYVPGETVDAKIAKLNKTGAHMPVGDAVRIAVETAHALAYAHGRHVVHRDVKPGNIMVAPDGRVKVLDVGIAALFAPEKEESFSKGAPKDFSSLAGFGTPHYMAPEQWKENQTTESVDVYGLGATLYHMLVGRPPFLEKDLELLLAQKQEGVVNLSTIRRDVSKPLGKVIQKSLMGDPAQRFGSMDAFAGALEQFLHDQPTIIRPLIPWLGVVGVFAICALAINLDSQRPSSGDSTTAAATTPDQTTAPPTITQETPKPARAEFDWKGRTFASVLEAAVQAEKEGDLAAAAMMHLDAAKSDPSQESTHRSAARRLLESFVTRKLESSPQQGLESATWAHGLDPKSWKLLELKGEAQRRLGLFVDAAVQFDRAAELQPAEAKRLNAAAVAALRNLAESESSKKQFKQAEAVLVDAVKRYPEHAEELQLRRRDAIVQRAQAAVEADDEDAPKVVAEAAQLAPSRPEPLLLNARLLEKTRSWEKAADAWLAWGRVSGEATKAAEHAASCWKRLGEEASKSGDHRTAAKRFEKATEFSKGDSEADRALSASLNRLGFAHHQRGDEKAAIAEYTKALQSTPNSPVTYRNRGFSYLQLKDYAAAERDYSTAIKLDRENAVAFRMRGAVRLLHLPEKNWKAILDDFNEAARIDADDPNTNYYLAFVYANCPDKSFRNSSKAVFHAAKACKASNYGNWEHLAMLAAAHAEAGQFDEAVSRIEQAEQRAPEKNKGELRALAEHYRKK
jgi:serine/threonine protein kinase